MFFISFECLFQFCIIIFGNDSLTNLLCVTICFVLFVVLFWESCSNIGKRMAYKSVLYFFIGNAIANAETPVMTKLSSVKDRYVTLDASGLSVGLPRGLMGNSEVGHMNCGAGRVCWQVINMYYYYC